MGVCVPKHIVCNTFTPDFIAGNTPCVLQSFDETRARLVAGGVFFRSVELGAIANTVTVECIWYDGLNGTGNITTDSNFCLSVVVTVTDGTITETYTANQTIGTIVPINAIPTLRTAMNSSALVTMPTIDVQHGTVTDPAYIGYFAPTNLSGGDSGPLDPNAYGIRTGPAQSLIYINNSEKNNADGTLSEIKETRYWDGVTWNSFVQGADCYDPNNVPVGLCTV